MKKLIMFIVVSIVFFLCGCGTFMETIKDKQINMDIQIYGFRLVAFDPSTGTMSPAGEFGFGAINYRSIPIEKGQPFYAKYTVKSLWSSDPASETIIWIGRASEKSVLQYECIPEGMVKISKNGIETNTTKCTLVPLTEPAK